MIPKGLAKIISLARTKQASDVHICAGAPVLFRIGADLIPATENKLTSELSERMAMDLLTDEQKALFREQKDFDLMVGDESGRYRVNVSHNDGSVGAVIRILTEKPRGLDDLRLPPIVRDFTRLTKGLVLITGSTSTGKTTTMSAMIDEVNTVFRRHVVTIEDPIEVVHTAKNSIVRQREIGRDTNSFSSGLRAALRQDPDVVAIGEMRDYETIKIALTAAETGILVLSTLHIISIDKLLERLLSYVPSDDVAHVRYLLGGAIQGVIHQELLPTIDGGKRIACEILVASDAARNTIRRRDGYMLRNIITTGAKHGMVAMTESVQALLNEGVIEESVAANVLTNY